MPDDIGSTVPRRQLGRLLRQYRTEAGVTLDAAADALEYSRQKIWRIESGMGSVRVLDVRAMCELYRVSPEMTGAMRDLAVETRSKGWWHGYTDAIPSWCELYVGLESAAARVRTYEEALVPDLLQTREYATVLHRLDQPDATEAVHNRGVEVRLRRQEQLNRRRPGPVRLTAILSEAALRRLVGDRGVVTRQLEHLLTVLEPPQVSIRTLPFTAGPHCGAGAGSFTVLDFPVTRTGRAETEPSVVYRASLTGALYLDKPDEVVAYETAWRSLDALALDEAESREMIKRIIGELRHD